MCLGVKDLASDRNWMPLGTPWKFSWGRIDQSWYIDARHNKQNYVLNMDNETSV